MEADGILLKFRDPDNGRRVIYRLTEKGLDLAPVLISMIQWSNQYDPDCGAPQQLMQRLEDDPDGLIAEIRSRAS